MCPHLMGSWGYAWLLTQTVTGRENWESLRLSSAASWPSPLLRALLRARASSSAAPQRTSRKKIKRIYDCGDVEKQTNKQKLPLTFFQIRCRSTCRGHYYTWKNRKHNNEHQDLPGNSHNKVVCQPYLVLFNSTSPPSRI